MDHADPKKADKFKPFAAKASAEVLLGFLDQVANDLVNSQHSLNTHTIANSKAPLSQIETNKPVEITLKRKVEKLEGDKEISIGHL